LAGLPALHEPAPLHVPVLSNAALIKLANRNQFSPILRDPGIEKQLATALTAARNANPTRFDRQNPLLGRLIRDPNYLRTVLAAYNSNPARFTKFHHYLLPFLRGAAMMTETPTSPPPSGTGSEQTTPPGSTVVSPVPQGISGGETPGVPTPGQFSGGETPGFPKPAQFSGGETPQVIPEPSSFVLFFLGVGFVVARLRGRKAVAAG